ncbi:MAG: thioredoxin domain-containing protein [Propionicimonas sp.]
MAEQAIPPQVPLPPRNPRLAWGLVVVLALAVLVLAGLVAVRDKEVADLRAKLPTGAVTPSTSETSPTGSATPSSNAQAEELMRSLPRRQEGDVRALGKVDAPVVLIAWSDFRCPFCAHWATTTFLELQPYLDSGSLRIEFRDLVLFGEQSRATAVASRAAGQQGKFWEYSQAVFVAAPTSGHATITRDDLLNFATESGVPDLEAFTTALDDQQLGAAVDEDTSQAQSIGLSGTPFFVINTTAISGSQPLEVFTKAIEGYGGKKA